MIFNNLTPAGDWTFGNGLSDYATQDAAIGLNVKTRILEWLKDCFFNMGAGVDWINRLGSKNQRGLLTADLRRIVLQSYGVTGIASFATQVDGRSFTLNCSVNTIYSRSYQISVTQNGAVNA